MRAVALILTLALAACGRGPEPLGAPVGLRDRGVPISSTTRGDARSLVGDWVIGVSLAGSGATRAGTAVSILPSGSGLEWRIGGERLATTSSGPGRFVARDGTELWLLWVDDDFRTAVIGSPDGRIGFVMDRNGAASTDRTAAALRILDFNGYDPADFAG